MGVQRNQQDVGNSTKHRTDSTGLRASAAAMAQAGPVDSHRAGHCHVGVLRLALGSVWVASIAGSLLATAMPEFFDAGGHGGV
jgi:hypothetical protein